MNQHAYKKSFVVGAVAIGVIAGIAAGFFAAHGMMGPGSVLALPGQVGEIEKVGVYSHTMWWGGTPMLAGYLKIRLVLLHGRVYSATRCRFRSGTRFPKGRG